MNNVLVRLEGDVNSFVTINGYTYTSIDQESFKDTNDEPVGDYIFDAIESVIDVVLLSLHDELPGKDLAELIVEAELDELELKALFINEISSFDDDMVRLI